MYIHNVFHTPKCYTFYESWIPAEYFAQVKRSYKGHTGSHSSLIFMRNLNFFTKYKFSVKIMADKTMLYKVLWTSIYWKYYYFPVLYRKDEVCSMFYSFFTGYQRRQVTSKNLANIYTEPLALVEHLIL